MQAHHELKPKSYFLKPHFVYFSLASLIAIHLIAGISNTPAFMQLIVNSLACVYAGCMSNCKLKINKETNKLEKVTPQENNNETMTKKDAAMFPIYLSGYLFGLYVLFKIVDKALLQGLLTLFFSSMGVLCVMNIIEEQLERFFPPDFSQVYVINRKFLLNFVVTQKTFEVQLTKLNLLSFAITLFPISYYLATKNWVANNLFGIAFSIAGIANFTILPNFMVGMVMLWGLFFYDIFWVYGTDVMIMVAKSVDAPIKIMFPYDWIADPPKFSMLGLGDIVVPGVFVALCLKYDVDRRIKTATKLSDFELGYFHWCFGGYTLGMITTFIVMVVFDHPQPALLFLVPGCTLSVLLKAVLDKKLKEFWAYEQEDLQKPHIEDPLRDENKKE